MTIYNAQNPSGLALNESAYLSSSVKTVPDTTVNLKSDEYFVMGDNRMYSSDSRAWGPVPERDIIGLVSLRAWPVNRLSVF